MSCNPPRPSAVGHAALGAVCCVAAAISCSSTRSDETPSERPVDAQAAAEAAEPIDLGAITRRAHFAFRERDGAFIGGHTTYEARVAPSGSVTIAPAHDGIGRAWSLASTVDGAPTRAEVHLEDDGSISIERGVAQERFQNGPEGLSQTWVFARRPADEADVVVRVATSGYEYAGTTSGGHHFVDPSTGLGLRYGAATWVDARGERTAVDVRREGETLVMRVPHALVTRSRFPATLDPVIGPELAVDTPIVGPIGPASTPAVAAGPAGTFLVAWREARTSAGGRAVTATRVSADGTPLDRRIVIPIVSPDPAPAADNVAVASDPVGGRWLVAARVGVDVLASRIDATGAVLDTQPIKIMSGISDGNVRAAFDGTQFFVAAGGKAVHVSSAGNVTSVAPISFGTSRVGGAACTAAMCTVFFRSSATNVAAARISNAGTLLGTSAVGTGLPEGLAFDGTQYLALWSSGTTLRVARIATDGVLIDASPITVATPSSYTTGGSSVAWNGSRFVVTWSDGADVFAKRITSGGTVEDATPVVVSNHGSAQTAPAIAWSGSQHLVAWVDARYPRTTIHGTRLSTDLVATDTASGVLLSRGTNDELRPAAAFNGTDYLVAWLDGRAGGHDLYAARLSAAGVPVGAATRIATADPTVTPAVATNGADFLLVWGEGSATLRSSRVSAMGLALDTPAHTLTTTGYAPTATYDGANYVVAWSDMRNATLNGDDLMAARISPTGTLHDPDGIVVSAAIAMQSYPAVASNGSETLIVWEDDRLPGRAADIRGARLTRGGGVLDPDGFIVANGDYTQANPSVAWNGVHYVVAWVQYRYLYLVQDIYTTRVTVAGQSLNPLGTLMAQKAGWPAVVSMGDGRNDLVLWGPKKVTDTSGIQGAWVRATTGEVLDPGGVPIVGGPNVGAPTLAPASSGRVALFYERIMSDMTVRIVGRFVEAGLAEGTVCTASSECRSRSCRDAVCCEEACDGACKRCGADGKCVSVVGAPDPDSCAGLKSCDAQGACKKAVGETCEIATDCGSGFCVDGFCCDKRCDGACEACNAPRGQCSLLPAGSLGTPSCAPRVCSGFTPACPDRCVSDSDCASGFGCDRPTATCVSGPVCSDERTLRAPTGTKSDCAPYACRAGACPTACADVQDCVFPAVCDEGGRCIAAPETSAGACALVAPPVEAPTWPALTAIALVVAGVGRRRRTGDAVDERRLP